MVFPPRQNTLRSPLLCADFLAEVHRALQQTRSSLLNTTKLDPHITHDRCSLRLPPHRLALLHRIEQKRLARAWRGT
jgi:hypothetical protein